MEIPGHSNKPKEVDWKQSEQDLPREAPMTWETTEAPEGIHHVLENCEGAQDTRETRDASEPFPKKWTRKMRKKQNEANRSE